MSSESNVTTTAAPSSTASSRPQLTIWVTIFTYLILALVMFGMACTVTLDALKETVKARKPFIVALTCQTLLMPAFAFLVAKLLQLNDLHGMCLLLLGCCPGGSFSNVLCYFAKGNQALSVGLTCITNLCALFTLPLLLLIWGSSFSIVQIPYTDILVSLSLVFFPAVGGIYLRSKNEKHAKIGERIGAAGGVMMILGAIISGFASNADTLADRNILPVSTLLSVVFVAPMGFLTSFLIARFFPYGEKIKLQNVITICLETGIQNTVLALAIINVSFNEMDPFLFFQAQFFPICWGLFTLMEGFTLAMMFRGYLYYQAKKKVDDGEEGIKLGETEEIQGTVEKEVELADVQK